MRGAPRPCVQPTLLSLQVWTAGSYWRPQGGASARAPQGALREVGGSRLAPHRSCLLLEASQQPCQALALHVGRGESPAPLLREPRGETVLEGWAQRDAASCCPPAPTVPGWSGACSPKLLFLGLYPTTWSLSRETEAEGLSQTELGMAPPLCLPTALPVGTFLSVHPVCVP